MNLKSFKLILITLFFFLLLPPNSISQTNSNSYKFVGLTSLSGEINLKTQYRKQENIFDNNLNESMESWLYSGGVLLNARTYVWHPDFLIVDVNANYNPESNQENYLVIPDRSEARTIKRLNLTATLFNQKPISLSGFANFNQSYINNEDLTNLRSNDQKMGGALSFKNKYLPVSFNYMYGKWDQKEILTGRNFRNEHTTIQGRLTKSFTSKDNHKLNYNYNEYFRQDNSLPYMINSINEISLYDNVYFDSNRKYYYSSAISNFNQKGNDEYDRLQARENLTLKLPENFIFTSNYLYYNIQRESQALSQNNLKFSLSHQLYLSLRTNVFVEYNNVNHSAYNEVSDREGININYTKKIPKGQLTISYNYTRFNQDMDSDPVVLQVFKEEHALADADIVLLEKEFINIETIIVADETGTIIYQENFDYILVERDSFIEIQRIPGGQIADAQLVYVDYVTTRQESFKYVSTNNSLGVNLSFFKRLIEVYYRTSKQDYNHIEKSNYLTLNYYTRNIYGIRFMYRFVTGGVEYDNYNSDLIPYKLMRYYLRFQGNLTNKIRYSLNFNLRDYEMITEQINQTFADFSGRISYNIGSRSKLNLESNYRKQQGRQIDLDLLTLRSEYSTAIRQLYFTVGLEMYRRNYLNEEINLTGGYLKIARKF